MVCSKCEKKLSTVATQDKWKDGARNTIEGGGRKVGENKALAKQGRFQPYQKFAKCRICKSAVHMANGNYCQGCAYKLGICALCGVKIADTKGQKQSMT